MKRISFWTALIALTIFQASHAYAATLDWSYTDGGVNVGSGTFDAVDQGGGAFTVDAITGTANGQTITGLANYAGQDMEVYITPPSLDSFGVAFTVSNGSAYNLYYWTTAGGGVSGYDCGVTGYCLIGPGTNGTSGVDPQDTTVPVDFSVTEVSAVPLPSALPLFATGFGALCFLAWRKKQKSAF